VQAKLQVHLEVQDLLVQAVQLVPQVRPVLQAQAKLQEHLVQVVLLEHQALVVQLELVVHLKPQEHQDLQVQMVLQEVQV
jgi:hypothetical protein